MNVGGGEAADQLVRMMLSGSEVAIRLSGSAAKELLALTMALGKQNKQLSGKVNMAKMLRQTRDLRLFPMTPQQYKAFKKHAKKQKLLFSAIKDKSDSGKLIDVVMPVTELDRANMIFERIRYTGQPEHSEPEQTQVKEKDRSQENEQEKGPRQEPERRRDWDPELQEDAPKKDTRSGRDSRDTRSRSSTQRTSDDARARNDKPSIEERLEGFRAQLDEKRTLVPTVTRGKNRPKAR